MGTYVKKNGQLEEIAPVYTAGPGIEIQNNVVKAIPYTAGNNILINENKEISCDISTMNFKGTVDTYDKLPTNGQDVGDVWNVSTINTNYCWNGSDWVTIGSSVDTSGLMNKDGSNAAFPEHKGAIPGLSTMLINGGGGFKTIAIEDIKSEFFPVDDTLSPDSVNPVQNKVITNDLSCFIVTPFGTDDDDTVIRLPLKSSLYEGYTCKILFDSDVLTKHDNGVKIEVNGTRYDIKVAKSGTLINLPGHVVGSSNTENTKYYIYAKTIIEFVFDGTAFIVVGNPEVMSYYSNTFNYTVKADGLIEQWGKSTESTLTLPIFVTSGHLICSSARGSSSTAHDNEHYFIIQNNGTIFKYGGIEMWWKVTSY